MPHDQRDIQNTDLNNISIFDSTMLGNHIRKRDLQQNGLDLQSEQNIYIYVPFRIIYLQINMSLFFGGGVTFFNITFRKRHAVYM